MDTSKAIRRALGVLLLTASVTTVACSPSATTNTPAAAAPVLQTDVEGKFSAEFPFTPLREEKKQTQAGLQLTMIMYSTETAKESVFVAYTDYPKTLKLNASEALVGAADGSAKSANGVILSKAATTFMGHPAMDVVVKAPEGTVYERLVLRDHRLYMVMGVGAAGRPASYDHLLETFFLI